MHLVFQNKPVQGEICDIDGTCIDAGGDELFKLTTKEGKLAVETEKVCCVLSMHHRLTNACLELRGFKNTMG